MPNKIIKLVYERNVRAAMLSIININNATAEKQRAMGV
jgi:hypothetical protein